MTFDDAFRSLIAQVVRDELRKIVADPSPVYLSTTDAARFAGVAVGTIRRWVRTGRLAPHRAGRLVRVNRADLERLMKSTPASNDSRTPEQLARAKYG